VAGAASLLVAGPNLTLDRTGSLGELRPGEVLRLADVSVTPGGKGVNVCRAACSLGVPSTLVSFQPGHTGRAAAAMLADEQVELVPVPTAGDLRSTAVIIEAGGRTTVLNEPGPAISEADWQVYERRVDERLPDVGALVCSGSLPPGAPDDGYARLAALARELDCVCVIDASGAALRKAIASPGAALVPNLGEAEAVLRGWPAGEVVEAVPDAQQRALAAARELVERGAGLAVVTAAGAGAAFAARDGRSSTIAAPAVPIRNPIGAGDAFTAALAAALARGDALEDALTDAVAAGSASVQFPLPGRLDPNIARTLAAAIRAGHAA
jgi:1-phosphofructokinase family hexose kinase